MNNQQNEEITMKNSFIYHEAMLLRCGIIPTNTTRDFKIPSSLKEHNLEWEKVLKISGNIKTEESLTELQQEERDKKFMLEKRMGYPVSQMDLIDESEDINKHHYQEYINNLLRNRVRR